ncbi:MAG: hypothetical protein ACK55I_45020, partial [bacterium]
NNNEKLNIIKHGYLNIPSAKNSNFLNENFIKKIGNNKIILSTVSYGSTAAQPLYGPGQGSTCGPLFWLLCYWVIVQSLDPTINVAKFESACKEIIVEITGVSFVDDSSLSVTSDYIWDPNLTDMVNWLKEVEHLVAHLAALSQHWERLLFTT